MTFLHSYHYSTSAVAHTYKLSTKESDAAGSGVQELDYLCRFCISFFFSSSFDIEVIRILTSELVSKTPLGWDHQSTLWLASWSQLGMCRRFSFKDQAVTVSIDIILNLCDDKNRESSLPKIWGIKCK